MGSMVDKSNFERLRGFDNGQTGRQMDICDCRVTFATENLGFGVTKIKNDTTKARFPNSW